MTFPSFTGQHVFVAGGSSGINLGIAKAFARAGANVVVMSRPPDKVQQAAAELEALGVQALGISADVRDAAAVEAALQQAQRNPQLAGIYHLAPAGETTWHEYASYVIDFARKQGETLKVTSVKPISTSEYPTPAKRPSNSRLSTAKLRNSFSLHLPDWQSGVTRMLMEALNK